MNEPLKLPTVISASLILSFIVAPVAFGQSSDKAKATMEPVCSVNLTEPGQMADILSNALLQDFGKEETKVSEFLDAAQAKYESGATLAAAVASKFQIHPSVLDAAIDNYKHVNCTHVGGGAVATEKAAQANVDRELSEFANNVLLHVVLHELGHALVREFDLPILGNEETLADAFATHYLTTWMPDRAFAVLDARIASLMLEANEVPRKEWTIQGEHNSDARRAYQIAALAIADDPEKYAPLAKRVMMDTADVRKAADYGTEIHRSWRRVLKPLWMPAGQTSGETRVRVDEASPFAKSLRDSGLTRELDEIVRSVDWHSQVAIQFVPGEGGAGWSRSERTITVHTSYIERFNRQARSQPTHSQANPNID